MHLIAVPIFVLFCILLFKNIIIIKELVQTGGLCIKRHTKMILVIMSIINLGHLWHKPYISGGLINL